MVKSGKFFSIFAVLTLLILLAPAVILAPVGNVAANGAAVTQEVAGSLSFSESPPGDWWSFTAGGNTPNATYGIYLAQYTRADVTRTTAVPDCTFRNYTTGSGSLSGDLSGSLSLSWITFNFNLKYPNATLYHDYGTGAHFGWMTGRGHFYATNTSNNFTFVFIADFDSDNATMSNAVGKGFLMSVAENGTYGKTNGTDTDTNKIIGDFTITKSGASYTGTYNLRIYPPNEVYDLGDLNVTGGVVQEPTDDIHMPLALLNFSADGPQVTPTGAELTTDFEEVGWGKDPPKVVTSGRLGINGDMVVARNTALYLELGALWDPPGVRIMGTTVNNIYIDDTNTSVRAGDGSPYGKLWELLVLFIPNQKLDLNLNFTQEGYTYTPFGLLNNTHNPTQCYAGTESFALATILISSSLTDALQWSVDRSFGLHPTPKVTSVNPASASPGATLNVTITGKYFLRADNYVVNSGSVSFGPNITVNSYTIGNASPIDNTITANITIAGGAALGTRNVSVTSCFDYANGSGIAPYETGTKVNGFNVAAAGASLDGHVNLQGFPATNVTVRFFTPGTTTQAMKKYGTTDSSGNFTIGGLTPGTYDVAVKGQTSLSNLVTGVDLSVPGRTDFGVLLEGDVNNDDYMDGSDYGPLSSAWLSYPGCPGGNWDPAVDFSRDNYIDGSDYGPLSANWLAWGDTFGWPGNWN